MKKKYFSLRFICSIILAIMLMFSAVACAPTNDNDSNLDNTEIGTDGDNNTNLDDNDNTNDNDDNSDTNNDNNDNIDNDDQNNNDNDDNNTGDNDNNDNNDDNNDENDETNENDEDEIVEVNILGFGDSISAGYAVVGTDMYTSYMEYVDGTKQINEMCYTNLIAQKYAESVETVNVKNYAVSGHKTTDMINILNNVSGDYTDIQNDLQNADIITVCIGANNVLGVLLDDEMANIYGYLGNWITDAEMQALFATGLEQFKTDYTNTILPRLVQTNAKVYVMTIYDPYKYFDATEITADPNDFVAPGICAPISAKFPTLKSMAIGYLNQINNYIKTNSNFENVTVVDVGGEFDLISDREVYCKYINADSSSLKNLTTTDLLNLTNSTAFDPHPTSKGQRYIANLFLRAMNQQEIAIETE